MLPSDSATVTMPQTSGQRASYLLKACVFATGFAGIVAEYVMATLASYLLGNAVVQWTLTISVMLFAMGIGSRLSKRIERNLLDSFIVAELLLSLLCAASALITYTLSIYTVYIAAIIYVQAIAIGILIGVEIPLVTRLNARFEDLRVNISAVMEKDYYGALLGGLLFAFVALPWLGLTYTPILLGTINFGVALLLWQHQRDFLNYPKSLTAGFAGIAGILIALAWLAEPIIQYGEQRNYRDTVVYSEQTPYQRITMTRWKDNHWLYLNGNLQFSTYDEARYHEPLVHPAMLAAANHERVLLLGAGDGLAAREVLKYNDVQETVLVDLDPAVTRLATEHPALRRANGDALQDSRVRVVNADAYTWLQQNDDIFGVIIIDLPDPKTVDLARLYSVEFYQLAARHLSPGGTIVTQAGSPFFAREAFICINKTLAAAGMNTFPMHAHVPTMGEWGWVLGLKGVTINAEQLNLDLSKKSLSALSLKFLNADALSALFKFGSDVFADEAAIDVNRLLNQRLQHYYQQGNWDIFY